jgi:hypothetical protein
VLEARASYLFAAPYSAVLYTDMYSHGDFVRMIVNSGFSGLNWSPEVRHIRLGGRPDPPVANRHDVIAHECGLLVPEKPALVSI